MGLVQSVKKMWSTVNDLVLNIRTIPDPHQDEAHLQVDSEWKGVDSALTRFHDNYGYQPEDYWYVRREISLARLTVDDVFYDIGCGMGRILCVAARKRLKGCVGVELLEDLCDRARDNAQRLRRRRAPVHVVCDDVLNVDLSEGTVFFLYNPFGGETLAAFLERLRWSYDENPRRVRVVYHNAVHDYVLRRAGWLRCYYTYRTMGGHDVTCWSSVS